MNHPAASPADTPMLPRHTRPPGAGRAGAWSRRGPRRRARRVFRPRRSVPGVLAAAILTAAGILAAIAAVSAAAHHPVWTLPHSALAGPLQDTAWDSTTVLASAAAAAFAGLLLILAALIPGRPRAIPLASLDSSVIIGVPRRSLRRSLARLAADADGIDRARVRLRRRSVTVRATTRLRDPAGLHQAVTAVIQDQLAALDLLRPPQVRVRIRRKAG